MRRVLLLAAVAAALSSPGCASDRPQGERPPDLRRRPVAEKDGRPPVIAVRKIALESGEVAGYLKVVEDTYGKRRKPVRVSWVHDGYFKVLGFYTDVGETYRIARDGEFESLGLHDLDDARRILLKKPAGTPLTLVAMEAPRTIESDAEAAAAAAAAAAAGAAKPETP